MQNSAIPKNTDLYSTNSDIYSKNSDLYSKNSEIYSKNSTIHSKNGDVRFCFPFQKHNEKKAKNDQMDNGSYYM